MSLYDYEASKRLHLADPPFYALIMAAMRGADTWQELQARYNAPGGVLPHEFDAEAGHTPGPS